MIYVPKPPKNLKGLNLLIAFAMALTFALGSWILAEFSPDLKQSVRQLSIGLQTSIFLGLLGVGTTVVIFVIDKGMQRALASAIRAEDDSSRAAPSAEPKVEDGNLLAILENLNKEGLSAIDQSARRFFPDTLAIRYQLSIVLVGIILSVEAWYYADSLRAFFFPDIPLGSSASVPLTALLTLPVVLLMILGLSYVQNRHGRFKDWRLQQQAFYSWRINIANIATAIVSEIDGVIAQLVAMQDASKKPLSGRARKRLSDNWQNRVSEQILFGVIPIRAQILDLPGPIHDYYETTRTDVRHIVQNIERAAVLTQLSKSQVADTGLGDAITDLRNLRGRLQNLRFMLDKYNQILKPLVYC